MNTITQMESGREYKAPGKSWEVEVKDYVFDLPTRKLVDASGWRHYRYYKTLADAYTGANALRCGYRSQDFPQYYSRVSRRRYRVVPRQKHELIRPLRANPTVRTLPSFTKRMMYAIALGIACVLIVPLSGSDTPRLVIFSLSSLTFMVMDTFRQYTSYRD